MSEEIKEEQKVKVMLNANANIPAENAEQRQQQIKTKRGRFIFRNRTGTSSEQQQHVTNPGVGENEAEQQCTHEIIIKDMCGDCGKDLRVKGGYSGDRTEETPANVAMIHHVPELIVSNEIANRLGARDHENIIRQRKLILLVDLDQTLVHTSNRLPKPAELDATDLFRYNLFGSVFFTKVRPYTRQLLENINKFYEMHIVTYGQRVYAHRIAELLDPRKIYFDYRVLSRDELLSSIHKTGNLKALFPCSEQLIVMLDDRPDVWMHSEALIRVKPYRFFTEVGDINAPPRQLRENAEIPKAETADAEIARTSTNESGGKQASEAGKNDEPVETIGESAEKKMGTSELTPTKETAEQTKMNDGNEGSSMREQMPPLQPPIFDDDNALEHIERVLLEIHSLFYKQIDQDASKLPNVKRIVAWFRSQVLAGEYIVFSGIIPLGIDLHTCEVTRLCTQFGATVDEKIIEGRTTVLIAGRASTEKMRQANRLRIPVMSIRWLDTCFERWQKVDKRDFLFREEEDSVNGGAPGQQQQRRNHGKNTIMAAASVSRKRCDDHDAEKQATQEAGDDDGMQQQAGPVKRARLSGSLCLDEEMDHFSQMDTLGKHTLHEMEDEIENALSEDEGEADNDEGNEADEKTQSTGNDAATMQESSGMQMNTWQSGGNEDKFGETEMRKEREWGSNQPALKCAHKLESSGVEGTEKHAEEQGEYSGDYCLLPEVDADPETEHGDQEDDDDEENRQFDYGSDTAPDLELDTTEEMDNEFYNEMVADIEEQFNNNNDDDEMSNGDG